MKIPSKWSILMGIAGITLIGASIMRYAVIYEDMSTLMTFVGLGLSICGFAYVYNWMLHIEHRLDAVEEYLEDHK